MHGGRLKLALYDHIGLGKGFVCITELVLEVGGEVALAAGVFPKLLGGHVVVELGRALLHGLAHIEHGL